MIKLSWWLKMEGERFQLYGTTFMAKSTSFCPLRKCVWESQRDEEERTRCLVSKSNTTLAIKEIVQLKRKTFTCFKPVWCMWKTKIIYSIQIWSYIKVNKWWQKNIPKNICESNCLFIMNSAGGFKNAWCICLHRKETWGSAMTQLVSSLPVQLFQV